MIPIKRKHPRFIEIEQFSVFTHIDLNPVHCPRQRPWGKQYPNARSVEEFQQRFREGCQPLWLLRVAERDSKPVVEHGEDEGADDRVSAFWEGLK